MVSNNSLLKITVLFFRYLSIVECLFTEEESVLKTAIEKGYETTSKMVLNVLIEDSKLLDHLKAIKNFLLLGKGDFIQYLLELMKYDSRFSMHLFCLYILFYLYD